MTRSVAGSSIRQIEEFAEGDSFFHRRQPLVNFINCLFFITVTVSFPKYALAEIFLLAFYPLAIFYFSAIPVKPILTKVLPVLPFIVGFGLFNPVFDNNTAYINGLALQMGWISFASLVIRGLLCALTALLTVSITGINGISEAMSQLRLPKIFITQFILTFRYIQILTEEAGRISLAYELRSNGKRKVPSIKEWGDLAGGWLLRTLIRAERIYNAMLMRGYNGALPCMYKKAQFTDICYMLIFFGYFLTIRFLDLPYIIGSVIIGG